MAAVLPDFKGTLIANGTTSYRPQSRTRGVMAKLPSKNNVPRELPMRPNIRKSIVFTLQRELAELGLWKSSWVIGVIWGFWHAPLILQGHNYPQHPWAGVFMMTVMTGPVDGVDDFHSLGCPARRGNLIHLVLEHDPA